MLFRKEVSLYDHRDKLQKSIFPPLFYLLSYLLTDIHAYMHTWMYTVCAYTSRTHTRLYVCIYIYIYIQNLNSSVATGVLNDSWCRVSLSVAADTYNTAARNYCVRGTFSLVCNYFCVWTVRASGVWMCRYFACETGGLQCSVEKQSKYFANNGEAWGYLSGSVE